MTGLLGFLGRVGLAFCVATTLAVFFFVLTLWGGGYLEPERVEEAVRALRGEAPAATLEAVRRPAPAAEEGRGELEALIAIADARERELRQAAERLRLERRASQDSGKTAAGATPAGATPAEKFQANVLVLKNQTPRNAALLMAEWTVDDIVAYLRAMKPYEAADILSALLALGKKGETDCAKKAREVQVALGK